MALTESDFTRCTECGGWMAGPHNPGTHLPTCSHYTAPADPEDTKTHDENGDPIE